MRVVAQAGPELAVDLNPRPWISLVYVVSGEVTLLDAAGWLRCSAGDCFVVPGTTLRWQSTGFSVVCLMVSELYFTGACEAIAHLSGLESACGWHLDALRRCSSGCPPLEATLILALNRSLQTMAACLSDAPDVLDHLELDRHLGKIMALLAFSVFHQQPTASESASLGLCSGDDFERLTDYIKANLDRPLNLTVLENRIHYSRRSIQYAFRQRLGCTATQWIRAQRLDLAHRLLSAASHGQTVASIAQRCGYRSMSLFSIDFQQRFHVRPSALLRDASALPFPAEAEGPAGPEP